MINTTFVHTHFWYILASLSVLWTGCKPLPKLPNHVFQVQAMTKDNFREFNGTYSNHLDIIFGGIVHTPDDATSDVERLTIVHQLLGIYGVNDPGDTEHTKMKPKETCNNICTHSPFSVNVQFWPSGAYFWRLQDESGNIFTGILRVMHKE